jgi:hypothetical protein
MKRPATAHALALATLAALASGCGRHYRCAAHGDAGALAAWQARGFVTAGAHVEVCEASAARFDAVYGAPASWSAAYRALEDALDARGFSDSPRRGYAPRVDAHAALATFERCRPFAGGKLFECAEELRVRITALPSDLRDSPFTVEAEDSPAVHHYAFGAWRDGPIPALAHSVAR